MTVSTLLWQPVCRIDELPDVSDQQNKMQRICWGWVETVRVVERARVIVDGMNQHGAHADQIGRLDAAADRIAQEKLAQALVLLAGVDRQSRQQDHRDRIRHVPSDRAGC